MKDKIITNQVSFRNSEPFFQKPFTRNAYIEMLADSNLASSPCLDHNSQQLPSSPHKEGLSLRFASFVLCCQAEKAAPPPISS